jgi:hypothetical protein
MNLPRNHLFSTTRSFYNISFPSLKKNIFKRERNFSNDVREKRLLFKKVPKTKTTKNWHNKFIKLSKIIDYFQIMIN